MENIIYCQKSMYETITGCKLDKELHIILLGVLKLKESDFDRFRDCYLSKEGDRIIVFTKCGGGNRSTYQHMYDKLKKHKYYITDYDCSYDNVYSSIEFKVPDECDKETFINLAKNSDTRIGADKLKEGLDRFSKDPDKEIENNEGLRNLVDSLKDIMKGLK